MVFHDKENDYDFVWTVTQFTQFDKTVHMDMI